MITLILILGLLLIWVAVDIENFKIKNPILILLIQILLICFGTDLVSESNFRKKIDLPEEISQVTYSDTLKGYYDSKGTLHIEFNNSRNK